MIRAKIVDLNALMFSPNFDDESELIIYPAASIFPFWGVVLGIVLGATTLFLLTSPLLLNRGIWCWSRNCAVCGASSRVGIAPALNSR
jgi:hypothetical protein